MSHLTITVVDDVAQIVDTALALVLERCQRAIAQKGQVSIVLAGGSTPKPLYEKLATQALDWNRVHIFWGDERYVPADHPDSNQRMARQAWLDQVPIPPENIYPMVTDFAEPTEAATVHEQTLRNWAKADWPRFDIVLLGMGDDGHTASLFPQTQALQVCDRWVSVGQQQQNPRLTLTVPVFNHASCVLFLVAGVGKQTALGQIFNPESDPNQYPAKFIQPQGELIWLVDRAASLGLPPSP